MLFSGIKPFLIFWRLYQWYFMVFNIGIYMVTVVISLLGVSKQDPEYWLLILENENLFPDFRIRRFL